MRNFKYKNHIWIMGNDLACLKQLKKGMSVVTIQAVLKAKGFYKYWTVFVNFSKFKFDMQNINLQD